MARKNRMSIPDAFYHVTTRIAHREMLLAGEAVKDRIMEIIYSTAIFSGVEVYAWCIMDNHLHILVHVPRVPGELWTEEGREPDAYAFGMRPPECREPMWPSPSTGTVPRPRPAVGFMLEDDEFVERLAGIYGRERAERRVDSWHRLEEAGCAERAMADRERLCRRMYNISQFMKTLKERVTRIFNSPRGKAGHEGALWQGRFHSGVVEPTAAVLAIVAAYIEFNPVKAGIADAPGSCRLQADVRENARLPLGGGARADGGDLRGQAAGGPRLRDPARHMRALRLQGGHGGQGGYGGKRGVRRSQGGQRRGDGRRCAWRSLRTAARARLAGDPRDAAGVPRSVHRLGQVRAAGSFPAARRLPGAWDALRADVLGAPVGVSACARRLTVERKSAGRTGRCRHMPTSR